MSCEIIQNSLATPFFCLVPDPARQKPFGCSEAAIGGNPRWCQLSQCSVMLRQFNALRTYLGD